MIELLRHLVPPHSVERNMYAVAPDLDYRLDVGLEGVTDHSDL